MATQSVSSTKRAAAAFLALTVTAVTLIQSAPAQASTTDTVIDAQMLVYEINLARQDPDAFRARSSELSGMPTGIPARPPLAISSALGSSSMFKANEMADHGYFGHQSAVTGIWPNKLSRNHGFPLPAGFADDVNNIESLQGGSTDPFWVLASFANSASHRRHIFGEGDFFGAHREIGVGRSTNEHYWAVHTAYANPSDVFVTGVVYDDANGNGRMDRGEGLGGVTVSVNGTTTTTNAGGGYAVKTSAGSRAVSASGGGFSGLSSTQVSVGSQNVGVDFVSGQPSPLVNGAGSTAPASWASSGSGPLCSSGTCDTVAFVDPGGRWYRYAAAAKASTSVKVFYYGNPGDVPFAGNWHGTGTATPGLYRQSDGFAYLRNSNSQGNADITFYFGNPSDVPLVGDFNGSGRDSLAIYRPGETRVYIINKLGSNDKGLGAADYSFFVGDPGDKPFVGDFNGDNTDTVGIYRPTTGWVYLRNSNSAGPAHVSFKIGTGWDFVFAGDWDGDGVDTLAAYKQSTGTIVFAAENSGNTVGFSLAVGWFPWAVVAPQV